MSITRNRIRGHQGPLRRFLFDSLVCLCLVLPAFAAPAATFCVNSVAQLRTALETAEDNAQDDVIRVTIGTYALTDPLSFYSSEHHDLTLEGGFMPGSNCQVGAVAPSLTVFDGNSTTPLANFQMAAGYGDLKVRNFTWRYGMARVSSPPVAMALNDGGGSKMLYVEWNHFIDNRFDLTSLGGSAIWLTGRGGGIVARNNLFAGNQTTSSVHPSVSMNLGEYQSGYFVNNTVFHPPSSNALAITFTSYEDSLWLITNNIVWNEEGTAALHLDVENDSILAHNMLSARTGDAPSVEHDNLRIDPRFVDFDLGDYRLRPDSPLVDLGDGTAGPGPGSVDAAGRPRIVGSAVDIGAFEEQNRLFRNGFE